MDLSLITVADFKAFFRRDFPYLPAGLSTSDCANQEYVHDSDITKAFTEAQFSLNQALFDNDTEIEFAYFYLSAHCLVMDLRAGFQGINGMPAFLINSRTVGDVTEAYTVRDAFGTDPRIALYMSTSYGYKYFQLVAPRLVGNMISTAGATQP